MGNLLSLGTPIYSSTPQPVPEGSWYTSLVLQAHMWQRLHVLSGLLQVSGSADEIECSSEDDAASPAFMQATTAKTSQPPHAKVCTERCWSSCFSASKEFVA